MNKARKISIVFITRNRANEIIRAIESCVMDSPDIEKELIIVDNATEDNTRELVQSLFEKKNIVYKYYALPENLGVAGGRDFGFEKATNDIVFFLDDDAVLKTENTLLQILEEFEKTESCGCVAPSIAQPIDGSNLNGDTFTNECGEKEEFSYIGTAHALDKRLWKDRILYPEKLIFGSEELYASLFLRTNGFKIIFKPDVIVEHLPSKAERYKGKERAYNIILNTMLIRKMYYPTVLLPVLCLLFIGRCIKNRCLYIKRIISDKQKRTANLQNSTRRISIVEFRKLQKCIPLKKLL